LNGIKQLLNLRSLSLNLSNNSLINETFENYESSKQLKHLMSSLLELRLDFSNNVLGTTFFKTLFEELKMVSSLRVFKLNIGKTLVDDETTRTIGSWMYNLQRLNLIELNMERVPC
jgi:hypothetical protein